MVSNSQLTDGNKPEFPVQSVELTETTDARINESPRHTCACVCIFHSSSFNVGPAESASLDRGQEERIAIYNKIAPTTYTYVQFILAQTHCRRRDFTCGFRNFAKSYAIRTFTIVYYSTVRFNRKQ